MTNLIGLIVKLSLVLSLLGTWPRAACSDADANTLFTNYRIEIIHDLSDSNSTLLVHCKSGTSDKGVWHLSRGQEFSWNTKVNLWRTTLYFCFVRWEGVKERSFNAFKAGRDESRCLPMNACFWRVKDDGMYFSDDFSTWTNAYPW